MSEEELQKLLAAEWDETVWTLIKWGALSALVFIAYKVTT